MEVRVWTKQHITVLEDIERSGRYIPTKDRIIRDIGNHDHLILIAYDWLASQFPTAIKPADANYPVWLSPTREAVMIPDRSSVVFELAVDQDIVTPININKWGAILNFSYLPIDESDARRHREKLDAFGLSDAQAVMSRFYPELKQEIISSWSRLFDDSISLGGDNYYGIIWEVKRQWIKQIIR